MTDNWTLQISPKLPDGTLINIRGGSAEEVFAVLQQVEQNATNVASAIQAITAQGNVSAAFPASQNVQQQPEQSWSQQPPAQQGPPQWAGQQQAPQQNAPAGPAPQCAHGEMTFRSGTKNGREWKAYFCPTPRGTANQCQPQFIR